MEAGDKNKKNQNQNCSVWQKVSSLPFFEQMESIVILHREMIKIKESNGLISTLILSTSDVAKDFDEQILSVIIDIFSQDAYHYQPRLFGNVIPIILPP